MEGHEVSDRQLEALLDRLDAIQEELARINRRLELNEGVTLARAASCAT